MTGRSFLKMLRDEPFEPRQYVFSERGAHGSALPNNSAAFDLGRCVVGTRYKLIYNALWQLPYAPVDFRNNSHSGRSWVNSMPPGSCRRSCRAFSSRLFGPCSSFTTCRTIRRR